MAEELENITTNEEEGYFTQEEIDLVMKVLMLASEDEDEVIEYIRNNMDFLKEISAIVYENLIDLDGHEEKYTDYYTLSDTLQITRDFLKFINPEHVKKFDKLFADGSMDVINEPDEKDDGYVDADDKNGEIRMDVHIPLHHNIDDAFAFVHEYFHTTNAGDLDSFDRDMFTEAVSIFYEFVLYDYLREKGISTEDIKSVIYSRLSNLLDNSYDLNEYLEMIYNAIDEMNIDFDDKDFEEHKEEIQNQYEEIVDTLQYFISTTIALVKFYEYKKGYIKIDNMEEFNRSLEREDEFNSLNYIFAHELSEDDVVESSQFIGELLEENKGMKR